MFEYERITSNIVSVTMTKSIAVGQRFRISASQGYAGVVDGIVEVIAVWSQDDIEKLAGDDDVKDAISYIESYKDTAIDMHTDRNGEPYEPEYTTELERLGNTYWVVYQYPYGEGANEGILAFPIEEFVDHTSLY
jgi:hypothetical protein